MRYLKSLGREKENIRLARHPFFFNCSINFLPSQKRLKNMGAEGDFCSIARGFSARSIWQPYCGLFILVSPLRNFPFLASYPFLPTSKPPEETSLVTESISRNIYERGVLWLMKNRGR